MIYFPTGRCENVNATTVSCHCRACNRRENAEERLRVARFLAVGGPTRQGRKWRRMISFFMRASSRVTMVHGAIFLKSSPSSERLLSTPITDYGGHESRPSTRAWITYAWMCAYSRHSRVASEHNLTRYVWGCANLLSATSNRTVGREICSRCGWGEGIDAEGRGASSARESRES